MDDVVSKIENKEIVDVPDVNTEIAPVAPTTGSPTNPPTVTNTGNRNEQHPPTTTASTPPKKEDSEGDDKDGKKEDDKSNQGSPEKVVCITKGPGKSHKISLGDKETLESATSTPQTICMSEFACKELVSQKFEVTGVEKRGYCKGNNPHVIHLTDAQVGALISNL